ncbi:MAG: A/G-specific adenine glycosylase, partial [Bacteroidota bacterium]
LPWRKTKNPYYIWLSEIILQQTRVAQGMPYYLKFVEAFPTVGDLANATEEQVLKLWQGLGYYSRARNLHATAQYVAGELDSVFPDTYEDLKQLKGVGDYTASAIGSICFDLPTAVVDGNVYRVLSRVFGIATPINSSAGIREFKELAQLLIDREQPGTFNQAIMEFGARHCTPQQPKCEICVFANQCKALETKQVDRLPVKLKKAKVKKHHFNYIVPVSSDDRTILEQRRGKGIWENLYQFPLVESTSEVDTGELMELPDFQKLSHRLKIDSVVPYRDGSVVHKLSHKHLYTRFWIAEVAELQDEGVPYARVHQYPVPILLGNFISEFSLFRD